jgi:hypothetical protein
MRISVSPIRLKQEIVHGVLQRREGIRHVAILFAISMAEFWASLGYY